MSVRKDGHLNTSRLINSLLYATVKISTENLLKITENFWKLLTIFGKFAEDVILRNFV